MNNSKKITYLLIFCVILVQFAGMFLPFTGDAGKYAAVSKTMYQNHEFWDLYIHGSPYYQKPPFLMWLSVAGYFLTGTVNNFTTRIFPVLFTILMLFSTYKLGKYFYSERTGKLAAFFMASTQIFILYNTDLHTDSILTACTITAIWQLVLYIDRRKWYNFVLGFLFIGFAMLTKGPIGLAVPVFAIGTHLLLKRNFKMIFRLEWLAGAVILLAMLFPHLKLLYQNFGWEGPKFYFWTNNAGRISGTYKGGNSDPFFYIYNLLVFTLPWSFLFAGGLVRQLLNLSRKKSETVKEYYTLGGAVVLIFVLSFAKMKSPNYFYPAIPLLAILAAEYFFNILKSEKVRRLVIAQDILNSIVWALTFVILIWMFPFNNIAGWMVIAILAVLHLLLLIKERDPKYRIINSALVAIVVLNLVINTHLLPILFNYQASLHAAKIYNEKASDNDIFYTYRYAQFEMFFYAKNEGFKIIDEGTAYDPVLIEFDEAIQNKGAWFFADEYGYKQIKQGSMGLEQEYVFDHYYLTDISWQFLNPITRKSVLKKMYLVKTIAE